MKDEHCRSRVKTQRHAYGRSAYWATTVHGLDSICASSTETWMPGWHQSHIRTRLKQTYFASVRRVRRVVSRNVRGVLVGGVVSRVRLVIAAILYLQRLYMHYAVADSTEKLHQGIFTELPSMTEENFWKYWKRHITNAPGRVSVDHTIKVNHMRYWAVIHVAQQLLLTVSNLKGSPHSYELLHLQVLIFTPWYIAPRSY